MTQDDQDQDYVDDVYADDAAYDAELVDPDMDMPTDEWAEGDPQESQVTQTKKKSNIFSPFNIILVSVAILGGGFLIWNKLVPEGTAASPAEQQQQVALESTSQPAQPQEQAEMVPVQSQPEIEAEYPAPVAAPEMPVPIPEAAPADSTGGFVGDASKLVKAGEDQPQPNAPMPPPEGEQIPTTAEVAPMPAATPPAVDAPPTLMTAPEAEQAKTPEPKVEIDAKAPLVVPEVIPTPTPSPAVEQATTENKPVVEPAEQALEAPKQPDPEIAALRSEVERLKAELEKAKAEKAAASASIDERVQVKEDNIVDLSPTVQQPKPKAVAKKSDPRKSIIKKATSSWELRSAKVGSAMIARKGSTDLQMVSVGDNVAGLGRITNISNDTGRWIVQGTSGRLMQ